MSSLRHPTRIVAVIALTLSWCALWGTFSAANLGSGLIVSAAAVSFGSSGSAGGIQPVALFRLVALIIQDLASSTVNVAREVLTPTDYTEEGIIEVDLPRECSSHLLLLCTAITLTPGTAVVEVDRPNVKLFLHLLHLDRRDEVVEHVQQLASLAAAALPANRSDA